MKPNSLIMLLTVVILASCGKADTPDNIVTNVSGRFYDSTNQEAYANVRVRISEYQLHGSIDGPSGYVLTARLDSTLTDINGYYKLTFNSRRDSRNYRLEYSGIPKDAYVHDTTYPYVNITSLGTSDVFNFEIEKTYYMKTRIVVNNNPYPPLSVATGFADTPLPSQLPLYGNISKSNNDTIEYIPIRKNSGGFYLFFTIVNPTTNVALNNPKIFLNPVINQDTIQGGTYNLFPATFK